MGGFHSKQNTPVTELLAAYVRGKGGSKPLRRILIASNGMAATKAMMSMRQWAYMESGQDGVLEFVAMATPEDLSVNAEFVRLADTFVEVPPGKNVNNYANVDLICEIAVENKVDAVWPGWGHASENPRLPARLAELGVVFIGPSSPVMSVLGDKIAAGILAQTADVPSIPWSGDGLTANLNAEGTIPEETFKKATLATLEEALRAADKIGFPVVLKASEGGGGKGIRMSANRGELQQHFPQVQAEVPGSPIFMMQLCSGARHIEVQIIGDTHGNVVALNGRDCSTQRRFQKIFEEGPPVIVPRPKFKEMERAAMQLTKNIGYVGAGTIEYLFNAKTNKFFFLELNPRLQVEHPVTEAITQVNVPSVQLQVAMGIPLHNMPDIRRFYGKATHDHSSLIDFFKDDYVYPTTHCIAARITAENPDDGFKPTSGSIERIKFQSSPACWGYFSVSTHAGIHEFADSQFGHVFAKGRDREEARRTLALALKGIEVVGEIRNPVDYLVELCGTEAFMANTIDTSWLDGLIKTKAVKVKYTPSDIVFFAAVFRSVQAAKAKDQEMLDAIQRHRIGLLGLAKGLDKFHVEIIFECTKYNFQVKRAGPELFLFVIGDVTISAQVRVRPDETLLVRVSGTVFTVSGREEALGLRLRVQGIGTIMLPTVYDPSELRSEFNGKVIRYLQEDGATVKQGEAYIELEAMKMIMPLKTGSAGQVSHLRQPGSVVQAGDLLARLTLDDPSSAVQVAPFKGLFSLSSEVRGQSAAGNTDASLDVLSRALLTLDGYEPLAKASTLVEELFTVTKGRGAIVAAVLDRYVGVEKRWASAVQTRQSDDLSIAALVESSGDDHAAVTQLLRARSQQQMRGELVVAVLRALEQHSEPETHLPLGELSRLPSVSGSHGVALLLARRLAARSVLNGDDKGIRLEPGNSIEEMRKELRDAILVLLSDSAGSRNCTWEAPVASCGLLAALMMFSDEFVRAKALELYIVNLYSPNTLSNVEVTDEGSRGTWRFQHPNNGSKSFSGRAAVVSSLAQLGTFFKGAAAAPRPAGTDAAVAHVILTAEGPFHLALKELQGIVLAHAMGLKTAGLSEVSLSMLQSSGSLRFGCFMAQGGSWSEDILRRDMCPASGGLVELARLHSSFELERLPAADPTGTRGLPEGEEFVAQVELQAAHQRPQVGGPFPWKLSPTDSRGPSPWLWDVQVFLARPRVKGTPLKAGAKKTGKPEKPPRPASPTLLVRAVSQVFLDMKGAVAQWRPRLEALLHACTWEVESARLDSNAGISSSQVFLHLTRPLDLEAPAVSILLESFLGYFVAAHGARLQMFCVDEIVLKVRTAGAGVGVTTLRTTASSLSGEYMHASSLLEQLDTATGEPKKWFDVASGAERQLPSATPTAEIAAVQAKRAVARRTGSTWVPEFLGVIRAALVGQWDAHLQKFGGDIQVPENLFEAAELVLGPASSDRKIQELQASRHPSASSKIGVLGWRCLLRTPEYPDGRSIVFIANDVTHQAGSFGVAEDIFFQKASQYARERGLPRIHFACNSGARVGLVEELMPKIRVKWTDPSNPNRGFEYLYLSKEDFDKTPKGAVLARKVTAPSPHYALEAIVGEGLASTAGGIGVENLQGSGLIAGETSRAYTEIFTLSYITGRSVGIGAYLNRLGQRTIQATTGPMILTGFQALNKLLGRDVYMSQDQLGGPQIMVPNGVTHQLVQSDQEGADAILSWLSYVPSDTWAPPPILQAVDPPDRPIGFVPTKQPYDPRHMLAGTFIPEGGRLTGFFDDGSFQESLGGWGRSVVIGRARLGGVPMGVIAVETRNVDRRIPADPGNDHGQEIVEAQAGQVWFPDSAFKTATAIRDFNHGENLPLMIFANWRGFSGGTRDMYAEVLKFGAMIVDALVEYRHPVFIYIPPHGELRGGSWVVIDPAINPAVMEMYADEEARGGILEPAGIVEVKFREGQRVELMHRLDEQLRKLDNDLKKAKPDVAKGIQTRIKVREEQLQGLYTQVACEFADLHDRTGRMKAKGAIREGLQWQSSRAFFHWRVRRRLAEERVLGEIMKADPKMLRAEAEAKLASWMPKGSEQEVALFLERGAPTEPLKALRRAHLRRQIAALQAELDDADGNVAKDVEDDRPARGPCFGATRLLGGSGRWSVSAKPRNAQHPKACGDTAPP